MTWTLYNQAKTNEAWLFQRLLVDLVDSFSYPDLWEGIGRKPLPVRDMLIASALKAYHGYSNRLVVSDLKLRDILRCDVPHFNSVGNYLSRKGFASIVDRLVLESALPLAGIDSSWSTDSTGFGLPYMLDWVEVRALEAASRRGYRKLHAICGNATHSFPVAAVTDGRAGDSPMFRVIARELGEAGYSGGDMLGDSAYLARVNCDLAKELGFEPLFHPKSNTTARAGGSSAWKAMVRLWRDDRETFKDHYRHRGNVESAFSTVKRLFGPCVHSRNPAAQDCEILLKVLCHNIVVLIGTVFEVGLDVDEVFEVEWIPVEVTA